MFRWFRCRVMRRHHWVDTTGDGLTDRCAVCGVGVNDAP